MGGIIDDSFTIVDVDGLPVDPLGERFSKLHRIKDDLSRKYNTSAFVIGSEGRSAVVLWGSKMDIGKNDVLNGAFPFGLSKGIKAIDLKENVLHLFYETARQNLQGFRLWRGRSTNRFYEDSPDPEAQTLDENVYRGVFFRFDSYYNHLFLTIDTTTCVTSSDSLMDYISKYGVNSAKKAFVTPSGWNGKHRLMVATHPGRRHSICQLQGILDKSVSEKTFEKNGAKCSVKEFLDESDPKLSQEIADDEPTITYSYAGASSYTSKKTLYHSAPSLLFKFKTPAEYSEDVKQEVFLSPERRSRLIRRFLDYFNPLVLRHPVHGKVAVKFDGTPVPRDNKDILPALHVRVPPLQFRQETVIPNVNELKGFFKDTMKKVGPYRAPTLTGPIAIAFPSAMPRERVMRFYRDCRFSSKEFFRTDIGQPTLWRYDRVIDLKKNLQQYGQTLSGMIAIFSSPDEYFELKEIAKIPTQLVETGTIDLRYSLPPKRIGRYRNAVINIMLGILVKINMLPWILGQPLHADCFIGLDVGGRRAKMLCSSYIFDSRGAYLGVEQAKPIGRSVTEEIVFDLVKDILLHDEIKRKPPKVLCVHRDGFLSEKEKRGISRAVQDLQEDNILSKDTTVYGANLRKNVPYRIFDRSGTEDCPVGSSIVLDKNNAILATTGYPLLSQGMSEPLLVERVEIIGTAPLISSIAEDVYDLSFLGWGSLLRKIKLPITIKYAEDQAQLAERGIKTIGLPV